MRFAPKASVHLQLTVTILLAITLSWLLSTAMANYVIFQDIRTMITQYPEMYQHIREPKITLHDLLLGPPRPFSRWFRELSDHPLAPPELSAPHALRQDAPAPLPLPQRTSDDMHFKIAVLRTAIALLLALLAGAWLNRRFSHPLSALTHGARQLQQGDFTYRLPLLGDDEFTQVAAAMNGLAERVSVHIAHLEEEARRRQQLLADVTHELRSPVTTMRTMAGALEEGLADDPERRARAVRSLVLTSDRLQHLVTDLLELAKLDLHELPLHRQSVDVRELAGACLQAHTPAAAQAAVRLQPVEAGEPLLAYADPDRLAQVLDNLLEMPSVTPEPAHRCPSPSSMPIPCALSCRTPAAVFRHTTCLTSSTPSTAPIPAAHPATATAASACASPAGWSKPMAERCNSKAKSATAPA